MPVALADKMSALHLPAKDFSHRTDDACATREHAIDRIFGIVSGREAQLRSVGIEVIPFVPQVRLKHVHFGFQAVEHVAISAVMGPVMHFMWLGSEVKKLPLGVMAFVKGTGLAESVRVVIDEFVAVGAYAVVGVDNEGVFGQPGFVEPIQNSPYVIIDARDDAQIILDVALICAFRFRRGSG